MEKNGKIEPKRKMSMEISSKLLMPIEEVKYLAQENTVRYRLIMRFFFFKYEEAEYWLYKEDVFNELKETLSDYTMEECERDLEFLLNNKSLTRLQDTQNINTINDFKYHNFRYQMTDSAVVIERMTIDLEEMEVKVANLEPRLFERINHLIKQLVDIYDKDENKIYEIWIDMNNDFKSLNEEYQDFLKKFHEAKTEELLQSEAFLEFKSSMINYINDFITSYIKSSTSIKQTLLEIDDEKVKYLMDSLISHQKKAPKISQDFDYEKLRKVNLGKWQSLRKWFIGTNSLSEGERLLQATQNVIEKIYKYATSLIELHGNMINRKEEYKHICNLFDKVSSVHDAHLLAVSIFGVPVTNHYKMTSELNTDSLIKSYEVPPIEIPINTRVKEYKIKETSNVVVDKSEKKNKILKEVLEKEQERKQKIKILIQNGNIDLKGEIKLDAVERKYVLKLIENYHTGKAKETEFGYSYYIECDPENSKCKIISPDGTLELNSRKITIEVGEKHGK